MIRPIDLDVARRPRQALQAYLDGLLQEATEDEDAAPAPAPVARLVQPEPAALDEFQATVLEEQQRDARTGRPAPAPQQAPVRSAAEGVTLARFEEPAAWRGPLLVPQVAPQVLKEALAPVVEPESPTAPAPATPTVEPVTEQPPATGGPVTPVDEGLPAWAGESFECLLFDVAGLTLAVPLVCLGSIYNLAGQELTPLFGQPEWFLGLLPVPGGNLKVLDTARWVMPDRYRDDFQQGLQYVISVQGYEWGLAVHSVSRSLRMDPSQIKWRAQRGQRPWLAGTVIEHMCALVDVAQLAEMIASGAVQRQDAEARAKAAADAKARAQAARGGKR
ncbi:MULTISPECIES: CheW domain-containing protein [Pseudomonas]|uniref:Chemotaxis protein CheW n=1 Tax=Pseudomonas quercus TaxID=2722792 RepID=A0ABX0YF22_9PSED|nr:MULTISPECIES: CheW domain-containing protein [Pseudomonas]MBF7142446.1 chemotaxis protein CheW [Pseudomonas sp. LY10J]NJP00984.1 chemotaxis protein CheW [Pseudomonas quercus]